MRKLVSVSYLILVIHVYLRYDGQLKEKNRLFLNHIVEIMIK